MNGLNLALVSVVCAIAQQSCLPLDHNAGRGDAERQILGKWYMLQYQDRGAQVKHPPTEYEFWEDGRFQYRPPGYDRTIYQGTWKISGSQLHQVWSGIDGLENKTVKSEIFVLTKRRLDLENIKKGRDSFYRSPKTKVIPIEY